jgi:hypothetical protein
MVVTDWEQIERTAGTDRLYIKNPDEDQFYLNTQTELNRNICLALVELRAQITENDTNARRVFNALIEKVKEGQNALQ